jgi:hypothetical protein
MRLALKSSILSDNSKVFSLLIDHDGQQVELECVSERHALQLLADLEKSVGSNTNIGVVVY